MDVTLANNTFNMDEGNQKNNVSFNVTVKLTLQHGLTRHLYGIRKRNKKDSNIWWTGALIARQVNLHNRKIDFTKKKIIIIYV